MKRIPSFVSGMVFALVMCVSVALVYAALTVPTTVHPIKVVAGADDDEGAITTEIVDVAFLVYQRYDAIGDECIVQDTAGNIVWDFGLAVVAGQTITSPRIDKKFTGLKIPTNGMDSGTLYIHRNANR